MATPIIMPKFEMAQEDGVVVNWLRQEGEQVEKGDPLLEVETDKVVMQVEAPASGILQGIRVQAGDRVPVTHVLAYILLPGEELPNDSTIKASGRDAVEARVPEKLERHGAPPEKIRATPAARRAARESGIGLAEMAGSGPRSRIQVADVQAAIRLKTSPAQGGRGSAPAIGEILPGVSEEIPLQGMRRIVAERMQKSYQTAPHITFSVDVDMSAVNELRQELNRRAETHQGPHITVTAILVKACAWALRRHPQMNSTLWEDRIRIYSPVHIGVAVALPSGLIVPVVHDADRLGLTEIAARLEELVGRAHEGRLTLPEISGGTFTISNLGMFRVDRFTAILNPPQSSILAVGQIVKRAVVLEQGGKDIISIRPVMQMTLSADHRVVDGATAAHFLEDLDDALETPVLLLG